MDQDGRRSTCRRIGKYSFRYRGRATSIHCLFFYESYCLHCYSLTLSMPLSPPHKRGLLAMHATGSWRLEGPGWSERAPEAVQTPAWPTSHYHHIFLGVRARRASDLFSLPRLSYSADAHRAIRFRLLTIYSIAVAYVSENARQRVSPLVSGVRAGLSGVRRECDAYES